MSPPPVQEPPVGSNPNGDRRGGSYPDDGMKSTCEILNSQPQFDCVCVLANIDVFEGFYSSYIPEHLSIYKKCKRVFSWFVYA